MTVFLIAVAVIITLAAVFVVWCWLSMAAEFKEISPGPRIRSEVISKLGKRIIAAEERRRRADVLRRYADAGRPVHGPAGEVLTPEQLRFAADLIDKEGPA